MAQNDRQGTRQLPKAGYDLSIKDSSSMSALYWAAEKGDEDQFKSLLDQADADITEEDNYGRSAIHCAAEHGHKGIIESLVKHPHVDVNKVDKFGRTALLWAVENNHQEVVEFLLENGVDGDLQEGSGQTALFRAAWRGWDNLVKSLLKHGVKLHLKDKEERTALHAAVEAEREATATLLLTTAIEINAEGDYDSIATAVLTKFWNSMKSWCGRIIRWSARNRYKKVLEWLFEDKVRANDPLEDIQGWSAFQAVAAEGHLEIVKKLLDVGADVNVPAGKYGRTALQAAAGEGHLEVVEKLLDVGADVNAPAGEHGRTALRAAAEKGYLEVVEKLLDAGADVNAKDNYGDIALRAAAERPSRGRRETAQRSQGLMNLYSI